MNSFTPQKSGLNRIHAYYFKSNVLNNQAPFVMKIFSEKMEKRYNKSGEMIQALADGDKGGGRWILILKNWKPERRNFMNITR